MDETSKDINKEWEDSAIQEFLQYLIKIGIFVCICKIWDNLTEKVQNPFLLSKDWLIALVVFCGLISIMRTIDTFQTCVDNYQLIKKDKAILKVFLPLNLIYISIYLIPTIILLLYLTNTIKPEVLEKTIEICMWVYVATWNPIIFLVVCFLLIPILFTLIDIPRIAKIISKLEYIGNALLNIKYKNDLISEKLNKESKEKNNVTGIDSIDRDSKPEMKKTHIRGIIGSDFDCDYLYTENLEDGVKVLETIFNLLLERKASNDYFTTQTFQQHFANCNHNLQVVFIDTIFEILEGPKTKEDGRTEENNKVTKVFYIFLKKYKEKNFDNINKIEKPDTGNTAENLDNNQIEDLKTISLERIISIEEKEEAKAQLKSEIINGSLANDIPPNKRLYLDKLECGIILNCNFPKLAFPYLYYK